MLEPRIRPTLLLTALLLSACSDGGGSTSGAIIDTPCASGAGCPAGFACEIEDRDGTTTSHCRAEDGSATCPPGYETEIEHGQTYCKPHGGDDDRDGGPDDRDGGSDDRDGGSDDRDGGPDDRDGGGDDDPQGDECAVDGDCTGGLECEDGFCVPHGGG